MSAQTAVGLAEEFVYQALSGDATLAALVGTSIYARRIPEGGTYPAIVYQLYSSTDAIAIGFAYYLTTSYYIVRVADRTTTIGGIDAIAKRVYQLLHGQANVQLAGGAMLACQRERNLPEPDDPVAGVETRTLAALYRIVTQEA